MIKRFDGCGGGRLRVREGCVWGESRAKEEVSRMKAEAERAREMTSEEIKKLREEEDRIIGEKIEWEGKRGEVGTVILLVREEVEGLREEREAREDEEVQVRGNAFDGTLGGKGKHREGGCGGQEKEGGGQEAVGGRHEEDGGW
jgi:hypothetical protein